MKWLKRIVFSIVAVVTLIALLIAFENWRGKRAWLKFKTEWEAKGESFEVASIIPPNVPDHQNFAMTPFLASLFDYEYAPFVIFRNSNALLRARSVSLGSKNNMPTLGARHHARRTDLEDWQKYFAGDTNFSSSQRGQAPAVDVLQALSRYDDTVNELRSASARPYSQFPVHYHESFSALLPHLNVLRSVADIIRLHVVAELHAGRTNDALADLKLLVFLGESLKSEPLLVSQLARLAILQSALDVVWDTVDRWGDDELREMQRTLGGITVLEDYPKALRGERALANDVFARMRRGDYIPDEVAFARYAPSGFLYQNQLNVARLHQKYSFAAVDGQARRVDPTKTSKMDDVPELKSWHPYWSFARLLFPALSRAVSRFAKAETDLDFAVLALALERYHRAHGEYPDRLEVLPPRFIEEIPRDVVSGEPVKYVRETRDHFLLYAVGVDSEDNEGLGAKNSVGPTPNFDWRWQPAPARDTTSANR